LQTAPFNNPFVDIYGVELKVGDKLAVAFPGSTNSSPVLRLGTVIAFGNRKETTRWDSKTKDVVTIPGDPTMEMEWDITHKVYGPEKSKLVDQSTKRYIKIK